MKYKDFLVFDFDGTLVQSMQVVFGILNTLAVKEGFRRADENDVEMFRDKGSREVIFNLGIPLYKLPKVVSLVRKGMEAEREGLKPVAGLEPILEKLKDKDKGLGILTSNSEASVVNLLKRNNWNFFDFVYSGSSLFGKDKVLKKMLKERGINKDQVVYVGDETRDVEAAHKCGVRVAAVTWGFNSRKPLSDVSPDWIIDEPKELLGLFA